MKSFFFSIVLIISLVCFTSCKSVGYHLDGKSTILRYDTVHVCIQGDKPYTVESIVK